MTIAQTSLPRRRLLAGSASALAAAGLASWSHGARAQAAAAKRRAIDGGMCMDCGERLGYIAHHWPVMLAAETVNDPDIALNHANLRWVCKECHDKYPGHGVAPSLTPLIRFDADGDPIPP